MVFSYLTSPVYHWREEKKFEYQPAIFSEGHIEQEEYAAIPAGCENCDIAKQFFYFLASPRAQAIIMKKNFMLPANMSVLSDEFAKLPQLKILSVEEKSYQEFIKRKSEFLDRWVSLGL